jgi:hypothetical protein
MDKDLKTILILGGLGVAGYFILTNIKPIQESFKNAGYILFTPGYKQIEDVAHSKLPLKKDESVWWTPGYKLIGRWFGQKW